MTNLLTRQRTVLDQEVHEPTLLAFALTVIAFVVVLGGCVLTINFLPVLGYIWWTFAAIVLILALLGLSFRHKPAAITGRQRWFRRIVAMARLLFIVLLTCWLGLIVWLEACPGGADAPVKSDPALIRVVTWNIHCGQDDGWPWDRFDWPARKLALRDALEQIRPDILCVQEARHEQVIILEAALPEHQRVGVGRDDGKSGGEHCAIYFNRQRFEELAGSTFWLEEPIDQPRAAGWIDIKRICTWVRLRDKVSGRTLRVYNAHLYLTETPRMTASRLILGQIAAGDPSDAIVFTADFNATPDAPSRRVFGEAGLTDSTVAATFQLYGIGVRCIDGILVDRHWCVDQHLILDVKPRNTFPSDHFGLLVDLALRK